MNIVTSGRMLIVPASVMRLTAHSTMPGFKFFCKRCTPGLERLLALEKRVDAVEERYALLENRISKISVPEIPSVHNPPPFFKPTYKPFEQAVEEAMELKLKSRNAVLFGVPEKDGQNDLEVVRGFLATPIDDDNVERITPSDIVYTFRDGPKIPDQPRFLKVVCVTSQVKKDFIYFVNKIAKPATNLPLRARPDYDL